MNRCQKLHLYFSLDVDIYLQNAIVVSFIEWNEEINFFYACYKHLFDNKLFANNNKYFIAEVEKCTEYDKNTMK